MSEERERGGLPILHFEDGQALEGWLEQQPEAHGGIWLKIAKQGQGVTSVSVKEAIDAGLCFGWIDGLINRFDERFYLVRYTPRRPKSKWSEINARRAEALMTEGRVRRGGLRQIEAARADGRWEATYPPASRMEVPEDLAAALEASPKAAAFFAGLSGANRYALLYRLHDVRDQARRAAAVAKWVAKLERGEKVHG